MTPTIETEESVITSSFGENECDLLNDTALAVATAMAYYHDGLIADGIDSFFARHNKLVLADWGVSETILMDTVVARYSRLFRMNAVIIENFFDALDTHREFLEKEGGQDQLEAALYCLAYEYSSPVYFDNEVIRPRGILTYLLNRAGHDGPCTPAGIFARLGDAAIETMGLIGTGGGSGILRAFSGLNAIADLGEYYDYMLDC